MSTPMFPDQPRSEDGTRPQPPPPLTKTLAALREGAPSVTEVLHLSDLNRARAGELRALWPTVPPAQRVAIVRKMESLAEERLDVNFGRVLRVALGDDSAAVRQLTIAALWEDDQDDLIQPLLALALDDSSQDVRAEAAKGLARFAERAAGGELAAGTAERIRRALAAVVADAGQPVAVRRRALEAVGVFGGDAEVRDLIRASFEGEDEGLQASALYAMGVSLDRRWLDVLLAATRSEEAEVRYDAARACGAMGDSRAVPELAELCFDADAEVRHAAINGLGAIGGRAAARVLRALLEADEARVRDQELIESALEEATAQVEPLRVGV